MVTSNEITFKTPPLPPKQPTLVYCGDTTGAWNTTMTVAAKLYDGDVPLAGRRILFRSPTSAFDAVTNAEGLASAVVYAWSLATEYGEGVSYVNVSFAGEAEYLPAETSATLIIEAPIDMSVSGTGKFYRDGGNKGLCQFSFSFTDVPHPAFDTRTLSYRDIKEGLRIDGMVVDAVMVEAADNSAYIEFHVGSPAQY